VTIGDETHAVCFAVSHGPLDASANATLALALLPAMMAGRDLHLDGPLSPRFLGSVPTLQDIFCCWSERFHRIEVRAPTVRPATAPAPDTRGVACFFSGGVDSWHTLLQHQDEITTLIMVYGFEVELADIEWRARASANAHWVADALGKQLIEVETDVKAFSHHSMPWDYYHGAALVMVGLLLAPQVRRVYIPSSYSYAHLVPCGSHPLVDPLWSTEAVTFVHDGCEARRVEKIARIAQSDLALQTLRVCFAWCEDNWKVRDALRPNTPAVVNCGRCSKCLHTMICLQAVGVTDRCPTFPRQLTLDDVARFAPHSEAQRVFLTEALHLAEQRGENPAFVAAVRACLAQCDGRCLPTTAQSFEQAAQVVEQAAHTRRAVEEVARCNAEISRVQGLLAEQTAWAQQSAAAGAARNAEIGRLQGLLAEQTAWAQHLAHTVATHDAAGGQSPDALATQAARDGRLGALLARLRARVAGDGARKR
jgi:hypothetical protein